MLRNLLLSFSLANRGYDNFEWMVLEHDTNDGTVDFLKNINRDPLFEPLRGKIKVFYESDREYLDHLRSKGIDVSTNMKKCQAFFGKFRNDLVRQSQGDIIVDLPDDHQFITRGNFCQDIVDIFKDRVEKVGYDDIGTLTFRTRFLYRIKKKNNSHDPVQKTSSNVEYFVVNSYKTCDDWGAISRSNFDKIGGYTQLENETSEIIEKWNNTDYYVHHYDTMMKKTKDAGLKKIMTKVPIVHDCINDSIAGQINKGRLSMAFPIFNKDDVKKRLGHLERCTGIHEFERISVKMKQEVSNKEAN
tara:strand:- start:1178 stop:2083 length:906 start_codon:yes stop_codon:yes gene_type:complete